VTPLIEELGELGDKRAVKPLIKRLKKDKDDHVRQNAAYALGLLNDARAVKPLIKASEEGDRATRAIAIGSLGRLRNEESIDALADLLRDPEPLIVVEAAQALSYFSGDEALEPLIRSLQTQSEYQCKAIVNVLMKRRARVAEKPFIDLLWDSHRPSCAISAAEGLGWVGGNMSVDPLIKVLKESSSNQMKSKALKSLARLDAIVAYNDILPFFDDPEPFLRRSAIEAMVGLKDRRALPYIKDKLKDPSEDVRDIAVYALKQFGSP